MNETPVNLDIVEVALREIIENAHRGDERDMDKLDKVKEQLKNN